MSPLCLPGAAADLGHGGTVRARARPGAGGRGGAKAAEAASMADGPESEPSACQAAQPPLEALAQRYLDLWQEQMAAVGGDSGLAEQMARFVTQMSAGLGAATAWADPDGARAADAQSQQAAGPARDRKSVV